MDDTDAAPSIPAMPTDPKSQPIPGAGKLGMIIFMASLSMLFIASVMGLLVTRFRAEEWPPPGSPSLPQTLWLSTLIIVACSIAVQAAVRYARAGALKEMKYALTATFGLGVVFLIAQSLNWFYLVLANFSLTVNLYLFLFYLLTGLHAVHVIGGLISLVFVVIAAWKNKYTQENHSGIEYSAMYWHFLDGIWIVLFIVLMLVS